VDRARAGKRDILDARENRQRQIDGDRRLHGIAGVAPGLADLVRGAVDDIGVIADTTCEAVIADTTCEAVTTDTTDERIVAAIAVQRIRWPPGPRPRGWAVVRRT